MNLFLCGNKTITCGKEWDIILDIKTSLIFKGVIFSVFSITGPLVLTLVHIFFYVRGAWLQEEVPIFSERSRSYSGYKNIKVEVCAL